MKLAIAVVLLLPALAAVEAGRVNFDGIKRIRPSNGRSISTLPGLNPAQCGLYCVDEPDCTSLLMWNARTPAAVCELRDQSTVDETIIVDDTTANYYSRRYCGESPCENGGTCNGNMDRYVCLCLPGFNGRDCEIDLNECESEPCQNGGVCRDEVNRYSCQCPNGFAGINCQTDVNECASNPCLNGGVCTDEVNAYSCDCASGFGGSNCNTNVDECASNPCLNGGACTDEVNAYSCQCANGFGGTTCGTRTFDDCAAILTVSPTSTSGVYSVNPTGANPIEVYCDMDTTGGGWLVFQKRDDGTVDFYRNWESYASGFGHPNGNYWLGNRNLHLLTQRKTYTLRVVLGDWDGQQTYGQYSTFSIASEQNKFKLSIGSYIEGQIGDAMSNGRGMMFSTFDQDNDMWGSNCAELHLGAWWHYACLGPNLNAHYYVGGTYSNPAGWCNGMVWWGHSKGPWYSFKTTKLMIRPTN